jgi:hypothetical protein
MGRELHWFGVTPLEVGDEGTDRWAVEQKLGLDVATLPRPDRSSGASRLARAVSVGRSAGEGDLTDNLTWMAGVDYSF